MLGAIIGDILGNGYDFGLTIPKYEAVSYTHLTLPTKLEV